MGATYTRQSSSGIVDGGVIEATDLNNEFDQLLAAFAVSTGHTHDGTAAEGGPITKLLGTAITIGDGTSGTDIAVTFDGESADGVLTWMEDEDYFKFSDDILVNSTEKLMFQDTGTYIYSNADGDLDIVSDGTAVDSINLESAGGITLESSGSGAYYGTGIFGTSAFGQGDLPITRKSVEGSGFAIALKITDTSNNIPWSIRGFQLEFVPGGRR